MSSRDDKNQVVDLDECGHPVTEQYRRLGAGAGHEQETGLYVRFEPGFGLNVHIGVRKALYRNGYQRQPTDWEDFDELALGIDGWETLGRFVDQWRARTAKDHDLQLIARALLFTAGEEAGGVSTERFDDDERARMIELAARMDPHG